MDATFTPSEYDARTILQPATGKVITPLVGNSRIVLIVDDRDFGTLEDLSERGEAIVTDLMTDQNHTIRRADCGAGCRCAIEIVV